MKTAVIHIGTEKTGSTYLQHALAASQRQLANDDFRYASFLGVADNHIELAAAFAPLPSHLHQEVGVFTAAQQQALRVRLLRRFASLSENNWIFSNEHLSSRLLAPAYVEEFLAAMAQHFEAIRIVAFVRRQDFMVPSAHSMYVKGGGWKSLAERPLPDIYLDHGSLARRWRDGLRTVDSIVFIPYLESFQDSPAEIVAKFEQAAGLPEDLLLRSAGRGRNQRLSAAALEAMRRLNRRMVVDGTLELGAPVVTVLEALDQGLHGPVWDVSTEQAEALRANWHHRNEAMCAMFPEQDWDAWLDQDHQGLDSEVLERAASSASAAEALLDLLEEGSLVATAGSARVSDQFRRRVQEMEASRSWRLTAPLRRASEAARTWGRRALRAGPAPSG